MTRRIVAAILLAVWTTLIVGGVAAYVVVRSVVLEELDSTITQRASMLGELPGSSTLAGKPGEYARDRYLIANEHGQTVARMAIDAPVVRLQEIMDRTFTTLGDGQRMRTLSMQVTIAPGQADGGPRRFNVVYSAPADAFDRTLARLAWTLVIGGAAAGIFAALMAGAVARRALKPLHDAAQVIRTIDVHHLDRRVETEPLPSELRPVATTLNAMLAALQEAVAQRRRFLADASHELRTPIAALLTAMEVSLSRPRSEDELRQTLQRCLGNVNALRQLVEHLLDQVRSEHFTDEEPLREVVVADCLGQVIAQLASLADNRNIRVGLACDPQLRVMTQPHRFRSIVFNLASNAIEHHHAGGWVHVAAKSAGGDLVVSVNDDGPGIAMEHQSRIFEPFYRINTSRESGSGHLGLGLFLVQSHLRAMGGHHELKSVQGEGTVVRFTLPQCVLKQNMNSLHPVESVPAPA